MAQNETVEYTPPPTIKAFIKHHVMGELFYDWIIGPVGSMARALPAW